MQSYLHAMDKIFREIIPWRLEYIHICAAIFVYPLAPQFRIGFKHIPKPKLEVSEGHVIQAIHGVSILLQSSNITLYCTKTTMTTADITVLDTNLR